MSGRRIAASAARAPALLALTLLAAAAATSQQPSAPPAQQSETCAPHPARLEGVYTDTREIGGVMAQSFVNTVRITWVAETDNLPPLPGSGVQPDGMLGSRAWRAFHQGETAACPVTSYVVESGSVNLKLDTKNIGLGGPGECTGHADQTFNANALKRYSALYLGRQGYLITLGAPDSDIPDTTASGECRFPGGATKAWTSPVNSNVIMLLDKRGQFADGVVRGQFSEPAGAGWTHSGSWSFTARQ